MTKRKNESIDEYHFRLREKRKEEGAPQKGLRNYLFLQDGVEVYCGIMINRKGGIGGGFLIQRWIRKLAKSDDIYFSKKKTMGMCLFCGDIDWKHLQEHHPDIVKLPKFTITLCANCHADIHYLNGSVGRAR